MTVTAHLNSTACTIEQAVEAIVATSEKPVAPAKIAQALTEAGFEGTDSAAIRAAVESLNTGYRKTERSFEIVEIASGFRLATNPGVTGVLASFHGVRAAGGLTRAAIETLAVVAYRQPVTRAEVEAIRGVACGEVLRSLMDRKLVTIAGRSEDLGRPMLYGTTKEFLEVFGLASIKDLPEAEGVLDMLDEPEPAPKPLPEQVQPEAVEPETTELEETKSETTQETSE